MTALFAHFQHTDSVLPKPVGLDSSTCFRPPTRMTKVEDGTAGGGKKTTYSVCWFTHAGLAELHIGVHYLG